MVIAAPYFWGVQMHVIQAPNNQNTLIVQSILNTLKSIRKYPSIITIKHA